MESIDYSRTSTELDHWFGLQTPLFMLAVLALYLLIVLKIGPSYMRHRKPYQLKTFMVIYNVAQVVACVYIVFGTLHITSLRVLRFWQCAVFEQNTRSEYLFNRLSYFTFWLKNVELIETVVFVLRKKQKQVSFLHIFHHCSTITLVYVLLRHYRGGAGLYPLFLNSNVHIIMYSYYLAAAVCSKRIVKKLTPVKKSITTIQMIQFVLILMQAAAFTILCDVSYVIVGYYTFVVIVIFYGFYDFYKKSYTAAASHKSRHK